MNYITTPSTNAIKKLFYAFGFFFLFVFWAADARAQTSGLAPDPIANFVEAQVNGMNGVAGLSGVSDVAMSPDGKFVYTASYASNAVSIFERNLSTGKLTFSSTVNGIVNAFSVVVSPDNRSVYVASPGGQVYGYNRDQATGALTLINSVNGSPTSGFVSVSISNDGKWVYGVGGNPSGVVVFGRDIDTGALRLVQDLGDNVDGYELGQYFGPVTSPIKNIATSTDGQYVYITSTVDNAVTVFAVNEITGQLTQQQVVKDEEAGTDGIQGASSLILSQNGRFLYVSGQGESSIALFSVNESDGTLAYIRKVTNGVDGVSHLVGARSLAMSPDGRNLFVSAITSDAVSSFECDSATGLLTLVSVAINGVDGVSGLDGPSGLVTDRFSRHLYVAGQLSHSLVVFVLPVPAVELTLTELTVPYNGAATLLDPLLEVYDGDSENLASATIIIKEGWMDTDLLTVELQGSISGTYDNTTGTLSLTGIASLAQYQDVLRTLRFKSGVDENVLPGSYTTRAVNIIVSDGVNTSGAARIVVRIERPLNSALAISMATAPTHINQGEFYEYTPIVNDPDGDVLLFEGVNLPGWLAIDPLAGRIYGTPGNDDVGTHPFESFIIVSDDNGTNWTWSESDFFFTVVNVNDAPTITGSPATTIKPGETYTFEPSVEDIDGDRLTFSILNKPTWASFSTTTGVLTGTPLRNDEGLNSNIVISVSDSTVSIALPAFGIEVEPAPAITGITFDDASFVYDGTVQSLVIGGTLPDGTSVSYTNHERTDAGTQTATATINGGDYYRDLKLTAELSISQAVIRDITFDDVSFVYDGTVRSLAIGGTLPAGTSVSYADDKRVDVGKQTASAMINGGINYKDLVLNAELEINKAVIVGVTFSNASVVYDGTEKKIEIVGTLPSGTGVSYDGHPQTDAGAYTVTATLDGGTNYEDQVLTAELEIRKAVVRGITFADASFVYDGTEKKIEIEGTLPSGIGVSYDDHTQVDAGTYTVTATLDGGNNYEDQVLTAELEITKAVISGITFTGASFVYDGTEKSIFIAGGLPHDATVTYSGNEQTHAGEYLVSATINQANHQDIVLQATLTIAKAEARITADAVQKHVYDGTVKKVQASLNHGETTLSYSPEQGYTKGGTYAIVVSAAETDNYLSTRVYVQLIIEQEDLSDPVFKGKTVSYTGEIHRLVVKNLPEGWLVEYEGNDQTDVGNHVVTAKISRSGYQEKILTANLIITKASQEISFQEEGTVSRDAGRVALQVSSSSGLPVSLSSDNSFVATVLEQDLLIHRLGTVRITASQQGDKNHEAAEPVSITVRVEDEEEGPVKVSKAMSPNGDGTNDVLILEGIADYPENHLQILSRNGLLLFESEGYDNETNAFRGVSNTRFSSDTLPEGTYFYVLKFREGDKWRTKKGWFVLKTRY